MDTITKSIGGGVIGTIVPQNSRWGLTNGYKIIEIVYEDSKSNGDRQHSPHRELG